MARVLIKKECNIIIAKTTFHKIIINLILNNTIVNCEWTKNLKYVCHFTAKNL